MLNRENKKGQMVIREYKSSDCEEIIRLFYNTVHFVNSKDYNEKQLNVWAPKNADFDKWQKSFENHYCIVAVENETLVGFGDIDKTGYLDRLYVHKDYQGQGVATALCDILEKQCTGKIVTHASITAKPFFEKRGYTAVKEQSVERSGIMLTNYVMEKKQA